MTTDVLRPSADTAEVAEPRRSARGSRWLLWIALTLPFVYSTERTAEAARLSGIGPLEVVRGGGIVGLLLLSLLFSRPVGGGSWRAVHALFGLFCLVVLGSALWSIDLKATELKAVPMVATYLVIFRLVTMYRSFDELMAALVRVMYLYLALTVLEFFLRPAEVYAQVDGAGPKRLGALVPQLSANPLAYVAAAAVLGLALAVVSGRWSSSSIVRVVAIVVVVAVLLATRTRIATVFTVLFTLTGFLYYFRRRVEVLVFGAVATTAVVLTVYGSGIAALTGFFERGQDTRTLGTLTGRTVIWRIALEEWHDHRVVGLGYYSGHRFGIPGLNQGQSNLDSTWIETLVDLGLAGTIVLGLALLAGCSTCSGCGAGGPGCSSGRSWWC